MNHEDLCDKMSMYTINNCLFWMVGEMILVKFAENGKWSGCRGLAFPLCRSAVEHVE